MTYSIIWIPLGANTPLGAELPHLHGMMVPHCVPASEVDTADGGVRAELDERNVGRGILMAHGGPPGMLLNEPTPGALLDILRVLQRGFRAESVDSVCANLAQQVLLLHGTTAGLHAGRRAIELVPASVLTRGDFIVGTFAGCAETTSSVPTLITEAAKEARRWLTLDTTRCRNEAVVLGAATAALAFVGDTEGRDRCLRGVSPVMEVYDWYKQRRERLEAIRPGQVEDIRFLIDEVRTAHRRVRAEGFEQQEPGG